MIIRSTYKSSEASFIHGYARSRPTVGIELFMAMNVHQQQVAVLNSVLQPSLQKNWG
jgi:hypothetical protein